MAHGDDGLARAKEFFGPILDHGVILGKSQSHSPCTGTPHLRFLPLWLRVFVVKEFAFQNTK
jgi:hypothetical protein